MKNKRKSTMKLLLLKLSLSKRLKSKQRLPPKQLKRPESHLLQETLLPIN
jgi:hypothetical protein